MDAFCTWRVSGHVETTINKCFLNDFFLRNGKHSNGSNIDIAITNTKHISMEGELGKGTIKVCIWQPFLERKFDGNWARKLHCSQRNLIQQQKTRWNRVNLFSVRNHMGKMSVYLYAFGNGKWILRRGKKMAWGFQLVPRKKEKRVLSCQVDLWMVENHSFSPFSKWPYNL